MSKCKECGQEKPKPPEPLLRDLYGQPVEFDDMIVLLNPRVVNRGGDLKLTLELTPTLLVQMRREYDCNTSKGFIECRHYYTSQTTRIDFEAGDRLDSIICLNKSMFAMQQDGGI